MTKLYEQSTLVLARAIYPTAWTGNGVYCPDSAASHAKEAVRQLRNAGFDIVRRR